MCLELLERLILALIEFLLHKLISLLVVEVPQQTVDDQELNLAAPNTSHVGLLDLLDLLLAARLIWIFFELFALLVRFGHELEEVVVVSEST